MKQCRYNIITHGFLCLISKLDNDAQNMDVTRFCLGMSARHKDKDTCVCVICIELLTPSATVGVFIFAIFTNESLTAKFNTREIFAWSPED